MNSITIIKNTRIIDPNSKHHQSLTDLLIEGGVITKIESNIKAENATILDLKESLTSNGWLDIGTQIGDPGFEHKEDLHSAAEAAMKGGFTGLACLPNTQPVIHSKSEVLYIKNNSTENIVDFHPIGAISKDCKGDDITEMYDMRNAGAVAFSDGIHAIQNSGLMMRSLLYVKPFNGVIINQPLNKFIAAGGLIHESEVSTSLGLKGIPGIAEELMVQRDLYLSEYTDSRLHLANISSARSVDLIRAAKRKGFKVTASVNPVNLFFSDEALLNFDSLLKVMPPVRGIEDQKALIEGLIDGTIDIICSHHTPQENEAKNLEFMFAQFGAIGLETAYAVSNTCFGDKVEQELLINKFAVAPYQLLELDQPIIEVGRKANLTFFNPSEKWTFTKEEIRSKSKNSPFLNKAFKGRVIGVYNNNQLKIN